MRKTFLSFVISLAVLLQVQAQPVPSLGMASAFAADSLLYASGFRFIGTSVASVLSPSLSEEEFLTTVQKAKALKCNLYMCNVLFPATLKIAGPEVDETKVLAYLNAVLARAKIAGVKHLVLGSGGARKLPDNYDKDVATNAFVQLAKKMAAAAQQHGVTIILEALNNTETNFINRLKDAAAVVRKVASPAFRLNADVYHMMKEGESPQEIINAGDVIVYAEIAEKENRTLPGVKGDDFRPYLAALKKIGFKGPLIVEGRVDNPATDIPHAFAYLTAQWNEAK